MSKKHVLIAAALFPLGFAHAAPPITEPVSVTVENTPDVIIRNSDINPVPVDTTRSADGWLSASSRNGTSCESGCSFAAVNIDLSDPDFGQALPEGKALLLKTITVTYDGGDFPATAAIQQTTPSFQRHLVGEVLPTPGFTGADGMATANLELVVPRGLTAVVGFTDPANRPTGVSVTVDVYVSGELVDVPTP